MDAGPRVVRERKHEFYFARRKESGEGRFEHRLELIQKTRTVSMLNNEGRKVEDIETRVPPSFFEGTFAHKINCIFGVVCKEANLRKFGKLKKAA